MQCFHWNSWTTVNFVNCFQLIKHSFFWIFHSALNCDDVPMKRIQRCWIGESRMFYGVADPTEVASNEWISFRVYSITSDGNIRIVTLFFAIFRITGIRSYSYIHTKSLGKLLPSKVFPSLNRCQNTPSRVLSFKFKYAEICREFRLSAPIS